MLLVNLFYYFIISIQIIYTQSRQNDTTIDNHYYDLKVNDIKPIITTTFDDKSKNINNDYIYIPNSAIDSKLLLNLGDQQILSPEYKDLLYDRKPLAEIVWNILWRKIEPIALVIKADATRLLISLKNKCEGNCHCSYSADSLKRFLSGSNDVFLPIQCPNKHSNSNDNTINKYNNNNDNITKQNEKRKGLIVIDKSMITDPENIDFEDEASVGLIKKAFGFIFNKIKDFVDTISLPEAPPQMIEKYVDKIKIDLANREIRHRNRDHKPRLTQSNHDNRQ
mmetsp:Transcript_11581/g.10498  ORF Transcript_11581/g.10498 Transcript_11581/m.10498 type:complete len:280 (+) Transcript_11581:52-891(+)